MSGFNRTASIPYYAVGARAHCGCLVPTEGPGSGATLHFVIHHTLAHGTPCLLKKALLTSA